MTTQLKEDKKKTGKQQEKAVAKKKLSEALRKNLLRRKAPEKK